MLVKTLTPFLSHPGIHHISVLVQETDVHIATILANFPQVQIVRCGANTRAQTVQGAIECLRQQVKDDDWVLVHDAARPGLVAQDLTRLFDALIDEPVGALLALPVVDTVKRQDPDQIIPHVKETLERSDLWLAQTPQAFRYQVLQRALNLAKKNDFVGITDEASAVEALGLTPRLVKGSSLNFKVTTADDLALARVLWA